MNPTFPNDLSALFDHPYHLFSRPYHLSPWKFPEPNVTYEGVIDVHPRVLIRRDANRNPIKTPEGDYRYGLWLIVAANGERYAFHIKKNSVARAFGGRATKSNLCRWAAQWQVGGVLSLSWTRGAKGERIYQGRYAPPAPAGSDQRDAVC